jgi:glucose/arabinose dehydrogenase
MTAVRDGAFYGFHFSYHGQHVDNRVKSQDPNIPAHRLRHLRFTI